MEVLSPKRLFSGLAMVGVHPIDSVDNQADCNQRMIVSALPVVDWRLLSSCFLYPELFDLTKPVDRLNEKRIIFSTFKFNTEVTTQNILNFLVGK